MPTAVDCLLLALMAYFITMNVTVERCYCSMTVEACAVADWPLAAVTLDFCKSYNPLFLLRPEWMRMATCISAYGFLWGYLIIAMAAAFNLWRRLKLPILLFLGMKLNALIYYHVMEFTSATPPPAPGVYFGVEGPYLVSIAIVVAKLVYLADDPSPSPAKKKSK